MRVLLSLVFVAVSSVGMAQSPFPKFEFRGYRFGDSLAAFPAQGRCTKGSVADEVLCFEGDVRIGRSMPTITYSYLHRQLFGISLTFKAEEFDEIADVLDGRYGAPAVGTEPFATVGGVRTETPVHVWHFADGDLEMRRYGGSLSEGRASITTPAGLREWMALRRAAAREAAARDLGPPAKP